jgi:hypothetical protein
LWFREIEGLPRFLVLVTGLEGGPSSAEASAFCDGQQPIIERLQALQPTGLALSIVSLAELYEGVLYSNDPVANEQVRLRRLLVLAGRCQSVQSCCCTSCPGCSEWL